MQPWSGAALWELSSDVRIDQLYEVRTGPNARLAVVRWSGTNGEGGAFDAVYVGLNVYGPDRPLAGEIFEIANLEVAVARFEELCAVETR